jgi:hypothetical protein
MKYVQVGILIALIAVGVLLFMVWKGQQPQQAAPAQAVQPPAAAPAEQPAPQPEVAARPEPAPPPSGHWKTAPKHSKAASKPVETAIAPAQAGAPAPLAPPAPVTNSAQAPAETPASNTTAEQRPASIPVPPPPPRKVTLDAGTLISVRLVETLSTAKARPGDAFTATLDKPLVVDGLVIAERGARLDGRVMETQQAGRVSGLAELAIHLVQLHTSDGQSVKIETDAFHKAGPKDTKNDAAKIGAGAVIGAAIGAIAGGGKGAGIGAAAGGAAGTGTVLATRGKPAVLPSETRLDFRLAAPVTITERTN